MARVNRFETLYSAVKDEAEGVGVAYSRRGDYSVFLRMRNTVEKYSADTDAYYSACRLYTSVLKVLGEGYGVQKQDVYSRETFRHRPDGKEKFLSRAYMRHFEGRKYTRLTTYLVITQEIRRSAFSLFDKKRWTDFWTKIQKVQDILIEEKVHFRILDAAGIRDYLYHYLGVSFRDGQFSLDNFTHRDGYFLCGDRTVKCIDMVDIDEVLLPQRVRPYTERNGLPVDLFSFMADVPEAEAVVFTQAVIIPPQRRENARLQSNANRKKSVPDPANLIAAEDIERVMNDIARDNSMLVYANYTVMIVVDGGEEKMTKAYNYLEKQFYDSGVTVSKSAYNQMELFISSFPGNAFGLAGYERFLTLHEAAVAFMAKEYIKTDEDTPLKVYYTDRQGVPVAIDITGKEGTEKLTDNSNFFSLGPSGSGKSFHMNGLVRQLHEQDTDIVLVDTGNSYEGLCEYFKGTYISYTEENPITMNPFYITEEEWNIEKQNFLKSLVMLIWKGADGKPTKVEDTIMDETIEAYYKYVFHGFDGFSEEERAAMLELMEIEQDDDAGFDENEEERAERLRLLDRVRKLEELERQGEGGERSNSRAIIQRILSENNLTREQLEDPAEHNRHKIVKAIDGYERKMRRIKVRDMSFNSFYEFSIRYIPIITQRKGVGMNIKEYSYILAKFYKGGKFERTLNKDMEKSLLNEPFIVFEIDAIKDDPELFPIVTLIIMDTFIQKMRIKENRKALIIEEAWKAIASPMMSGYIKYLYKTVRKFWGIVGVVTQELNDIIANDTVKDAIINNSEITILLDQSKFRDRYGEIAQLLGLSEVEQRKIWTINQLDNKEGRAFFKEVYIRRGQHGDVFGVEESPESYMAYTTERVEKDALKVYVRRFGDYERAITRFVADWKGCCGEKSKADKYASVLSAAVKVYGDAGGEDAFFRDWERFERSGRKGVFAWQTAVRKRPLGEWDPEGKEGGA